MVANKASLNYLLDEYSQSLLTEEFRLRIRDRELAKLFPFSIHNIYRVLMAIAAPFYEGFALLDDQLDFNNPQVQELLGPSNRLLRYFHVVLVGACLPNAALPDWSFTRLQSLADPVARRIAAQLSIPESRLDDSERHFYESSADKRLVITLAVYLREFVDYIFMGQHDHGFTSYPPIQTARGILVLRRFQIVPTPTIPWSGIDIYTCYDHHVYGELHYDHFRGDIEWLPDPTHLQAATAVLPVEKRSLTNSEIKQVLVAVEQELIATKKQLGCMSFGEAEQKLSLMFSTDLLHLLEYAGQNVELWRRRLVQNVAKLHNEADKEENTISCKQVCFTDIYIANLTRAIDIIRKEIKNE